LREDRKGERGLIVAHSETADDLRAIAEGLVAASLAGIFLTAFVVVS